MNTHKLTVGLIQQRCSADADQNLTASIEGIRKAAARGARLLLLPELHGSLYFCQTEDTGQFDLAYRLPQMVLEFIPATVWPLIMAAISESHERDPGRLGEGLARYYRMLFVLCAPICATGAVLAGKMITIFYGQQMAAAAIPAQVFFGIFTLSFFGTPLSMGLYVMEKTHINLVIYLVLAVINVGLDLLLIPRFGLAGAMVPVAIVMFISPFIYRVVLGRMVEDLAIPWKFIARCFLASAPVALIVPLLRYVDNVGTLLAAVVVAIGILIVSFKKARVLGGDEFNVLGSIPVPMADRFLRFMSS